MNYVIYKFTNKINGKSYIGLTTQTLEKRVYLHFWKANKNPVCHFHKAIAKYDKDSWAISVLEEGVAPDKQYVKDRECHFIAEHNTYVEGYNSTEGGEDFSSSEYQRQLQLDRVKAGTHPFLGGSIQRESNKRRWARGDFAGQNHRRIAEGKHHFVGESNPQKRLAAEGRHHNQKPAWRNTKTLQSPDALKAWLIADELYIWFQANHHKKRGGSYKAMGDTFGFKNSLQKMYYEYFCKGWNPLQDPDWVEFRLTTQSKQP